MSVKSALQTRFGQDLHSSLLSDENARLGSTHIFLNMADVATLEAVLSSRCTDSLGLLRRWGACQTALGICYQYWHPSLEKESTPLRLTATVENSTPL